jgi:hypothetical protein
MDRARRASGYLVAALSVVFLPGILFAQAGKSGMAFLKLGVSGRGVSMADAMAGSVDGAAATYYNPAGLVPPTGSSGTQLMFMHKVWIQDTRMEFLGGSGPLSENDALGISLTSTTVSDIEIRTRPGAAEGIFTARNFAAGASYARRISDNVRLGVTAKFLYEKILIDEASGFAFDIGTQFATPIENLTVGAVVANLGKLNALETDPTVLPSLARIGPAYTFALSDDIYRFQLAADLLHIFPEGKSYINAGMEVNFNRIASGRAGYQFGSKGRGFTAGVGLAYGIFALDYAYAPLSSDLGNTHTIALALNL